jgi:hypothetical protein
MKKYLILYHSPASLRASTQKLSREQQAAGMKGWMDWAARCGKNLVDMGSPLGNGKVLRHGTDVTDSRKNAGGYSIIQAENMKAVKSMLKDHPHLNWSPKATIEVHELMQIPGM